MNSSPFKYHKIKLDNNSILYAINIEDFDLELTKFIDDKIVSICVPGETNYDVSIIKKKILKFLETKNKKTKTGKANTIVLGYICEFIIHLFFTHLGYKQEFQFLNLEDGGGMKKGFDGVYTFKKLDWYLESKSGASQNKHPNKIKEAYNDLHGKFSGNSKNNPWFNALNHSKIAKSSKTLVNKIEALSINFDLEKYGIINDFNIIPCSTIVLEDDWEEIKKAEIKQSILKLISDFNYTNLIIVCINKKSLTHFRNYLNS